MSRSCLANNRTQSAVGQGVLPCWTSTGLLLRQGWLGHHYNFFVSSTCVILYFLGLNNEPKIIKQVTKNRLSYNEKAYIINGIC